MGRTSGEVRTTTVINPANVLTGTLKMGVTTGATTVITIPAGRTWVGSIGVNSVASQNAAVVAGATALGTISVAGAGAIPAAGTIMTCDAFTGGGAAGGTTGEQLSTSIVMPFVIVAPAGNAVTVQAAAIIAGAASEVGVTAAGLLQ